MLHMSVAWLNTYIQHNQHIPLYAFRLPLMCRSATKTTPATTECGSGEPTVRLTMQAHVSVVVSDLAVVVWYLLARSPMPQMPVAWSHTYIQHN